MILSIISLIDKNNLMETTFSENNDTIKNSGTVQFFDRKLLINSKKRPKPIIFQIFLSSRYLEESQSGAWAVLIQRCPQEGMPMIGQTAYLVSGVENSIGNIEFRLRGLKEAMLWMTSTIEKENWPYIEATLMTSDIFLVNLLREWIPRWARKNFCLSANSEEKRPHADLLKEISEISTVAKLNVEWHPYHSLQMQEVNKKADSLLFADPESSQSSENK